MSNLADGYRLLTQRDLDEAKLEEFRAKRERFGEAIEPKPVRATYTCAKDFEALARLLSGWAGSMREHHEGTEYERLACTIRWHPETFALAKRAERILGMLARRARAESEKYMRIHKQELEDGSNH